MDNNSATPDGAQDVAARLEAAMFNEQEVADQNEPDENHDEVVLEDEETLPESDDADSEEEDGSDLEDIAQDGEMSLADYLGVDEDRIIVDEDGSVSLNTIIDGETKAVPLKDLTASYQLQGHVNNKSIALESERKEFETTREQVATELQTRIQQIDGLAKVVEEQLVSDFNSIDWDRLRVENPTEWTALRQEYSEKAQNIQRMKSEVFKQGKTLFDEQSATAKAKHQEHMKNEMQKVIDNNPEWANPEKLQSDMASIKTFLNNSYGFTEEDMAAVTDHRLIKLIQDAKSFREGKKGAETKIVKKVPKFQKPGATRKQVASASKARAVKAKREAVRKSGDVDSVANLLLDRM